jgi:2-polyprenyl-3-methyl-5-hydroxy-6-metoxy-1,4-benzoquinol methylase
MTEIQTLDEPLASAAPAESPCRLCATPLTEIFADLGMSPLANAYLKRSQLHNMEPFYPLRAHVCAACKLVQVEEFEEPSKIFGDYAYFSSYSTSWLEHARRYTDQMTARFDLGAGSQVLEVASNDGYLLQYFVEKNIPVLGIEPAANVAAAAIKKGVPTRSFFFGAATARDLVKEGYSADLLIANNVLAHVPDLHSFVAGIKIALKPAGVITVEFPHLLQLMRHTQFDTIYHEHFCYFSLLVIERLFARHALAVFDVEELATHGGSLRIFGKHSGDASKPVTASVHKLREQEAAARLDQLDSYRHFSGQVKQAKLDILQFFLDTRRAGKTIAGYGAPAKGNTLLNYCGIKTDLLPFTVDLNPHKQGSFLPGTHIPIEAPEAICKMRPDYVFILPWNLKQEIANQLSYIREWGGKFVVAIPSIEIF